MPWHYFSFAFRAMRPSWRCYGIALLFLLGSGWRIIKSFVPGILVPALLHSIDCSCERIEQIFPHSVQFDILKRKVTAMATHHAVPGEIVDLASWANDLPNEKTKVIIKTDEMELARLVVPKNKEFPNHHVPGAIVVHCVQGKIELTAMGKTQELQEGQLLYLMPGEPHSLKGIEDAVIVLTVFLKRVIH
jgi:quercetin dioxygenase-like cupin family protein